MTPNWLASFALIVWPLVAIILYATRPVVPATLWTILAAQLLLPVGTFFKFTMIPALDKGSIPSFCALFGCMLATGRPVQLWRRFGAVECLIVVYLLSPVVTIAENAGESAGRVFDACNRRFGLFCPASFRD
jgi:hypothetical protein